MPPRRGDDFTTDRITGRMMHRASIHRIPLCSYTANNGASGKPGAVHIETRTRYPQPLRRVGYYDAQSDRRFNFLTNHFAVPAATVAELYRHRWQVELFFKWIKQHLRIKSFFGASENAVKTQL